MSYSRKDKWESRAIFNHFRSSGLNVWIDMDLKPGTPDWSAGIDSALNECACIVCLCSQNAVASEWVNYELETSLKNGKRIYPVVVSDYQNGFSVSKMISHIQATNVTQDYGSAMSRLIAEIVRNHPEVRPVDFDTIFSLSGIKWTHFGSLFWFASEIRKLRLLLKPETYNSERVVASCMQLHHHAKRINIDKFSLRDIDNVVDSMSRLSGKPDDKVRDAIENKLRMIQDNVARMAESVDIDFSDGPIPGAPIQISNKSNSVLDTDR